MSIVRNATTSNDYEELYDYDDSEGAGFHPSGIIKKAGTNSMTARISLTSVFRGNEQQGAFEILGGTSFEFECMVNPPVLVEVPIGRIRIEVKSTLSDLHTNYQARVIFP